MNNLMTNTRSAVADQSDLIAAVAAFAELSADTPPIRDKLSATRYLDRHLSNLARVSELAAALGYGGLRRACRVVRETAEALRVRDEGLSPQTITALETWAELVRWYLELPPDAGATEVAVHHLRLPHWVTPLDTAEAELVQAMLLVERRQTTAKKG
jgi:hypothetical protein